MDMTISLCATCYREIEAELYIKPDGSIWMKKSCPVHGETDAMAERSASFWYACHQVWPNNVDKVNSYNNMTNIEVTDRCNLECKHCYHQPDNSIKDRSADHIIAKALSCVTPIVCLMGAEPTMRPDLPYIISQIRIHGKKPFIYTNGLKFADKNYAREIKNAGIERASFSVHSSQYHHQKVFERVIQGLLNAKEAEIPFGQISFTVTDLEKELENAMETIMKLHWAGIEPGNFCIRTPAEIGKEFDDAEYFGSDIFLALKALCFKKKLPCHIDNLQNNPYHIAVDVNGAKILLIHWPTVKNIDIKFMSMGPFSSFIDNTIGSFCLNTIMRDGMKKGYFNGYKLITEVKDEPVS